MPELVTTLRPRGAERAPVRPRLPFNARPVSAGGRACGSTEGPYATHYTSVASWLYINRLSGTDRFGKVPDGYVERGDLVAAGRCHPQQKIPPEFKSGDRLWREADEAAALEGSQAIAATHIVADLPLDIDLARVAWLVAPCRQRHDVDKGMIVDRVIHAPVDAEGRSTGPIHTHLLATARCWRANGRWGGRQWQWLANADQIRTAEDAWLKPTGLRPATA